MLKKFFIIFIFIFFTKYNFAYTFKDRLPLAKKGDFIVLIDGKIYTLVLLNKIKENNKSITISEISILKNHIKKNFSWKNWVLNGVKKNISFNMYKIDIEKNNIIKAYSFSKNCWIHVKEENFLFKKLLNTKLKLLKKNQIKKIGQAPLKEEIDRRAIFIPPFFKEGKRCKNFTFDVYRIHFPQDNSIFSNKKIDLYFEKNFFLPFYGYIKSVHFDVVLKTIDSGENLFLEKKFPKKNLLH